MSLGCIICLTCSFFPLITVFDASLFRNNFHSSSYPYLSVIILRTNSVKICDAFPLLVRIVIKLGRRVTYGNREPVNTTKQSFRTTRACCNIEFIESFYIEVVSLHITCCPYITCIHSFFVILSEL